eukprot:SAG31_NODE_588_length_13820_cov_47.352452_4_plen_47_part_00
MMFRRVFARVYDKLPEEQGEFPSRTQKTIIMALHVIWFIGYNHRAV